MKKLILFFIAILCFWSAFIFAQTIAPAIQWENTIFGKNDDLLYSVIATGDGGYLLGGSSISGKNGDKTEKNEGDYDYWVVKLDGSGNRNLCGENNYRKWHGQSKINYSVKSQFKLNLFFIPNPY